ncbi:MAG TPA: LLM class flavin-dependent oxidoreductase [Pyrinomonadaceae bacterium]|nr:LLM class flavin-dependent oxidoreductase [Pyrinomonadaceae bacterium]
MTRTDRPPLRFHWRLPHGGETSGATRAAQSRREIGLPDLAAQVDFCRHAERCGIDSLLTDFGRAKPDSILLATALGLATEKIKFIVAYRSGLLAPTSFVQQLNTLSALINGRFSLNIVAGYSPEEQRAYGDFLSHDERYERTDEFLAVCQAFWRGEGKVNFEGKYYRVENGELNTPFVSSERRSPEIFIGGSSQAAEELAVRRGSCWMRLADTPENLQSSVAPVLAKGVEVGLRLSIISRPTHDEAVSAAYSMIEGLDDGERAVEKEREFVRRSDSVSINSTYQLAEKEWLSPQLWAGAVRSHGAPSIALVGAPEEIASAFMDYRRIGISQFILAGWPKLDSMLFFCREILPLIREKENDER